jgi:hypothetical protein
VRLLQQACDPTRVVIDLLPPRLLPFDVIARVAETQPALLCLGAVVPGGVPLGSAHLWVRRPRPALRPALVRIRLIGVGEARLPTGQPTTPSSRSRDR